MGEESGDGSHMKTFPWGKVSPQVTDEGCKLFVLMTGRILDAEVRTTGIAVK